MSLDFKLTCVATKVPSAVGYFVLVRFLYKLWMLNHVLYGIFTKVEGLEMGA
jgi:hypothetical protein